MGATTSPLQEQGGRRALRKILFTFGFVAIANETAEGGILHFVWRTNRTSPLRSVRGIT
jgi:hypothetical protein